MSTKKITPHKGGRTARLYIRIRPEVKAQLERMAETHGLTVADLIENTVTELWRFAPKGLNKP